MLKHLAKRFLLMLLSLMLVSFVAFVIIELPPGNYLELYIKQLELRGETVDQGRIESMKIQYGYDKPFIGRYWRWVTNIITKGDFGRSFQWGEPVSKLLGVA